MPQPKGAQTVVYSFEAKPHIPEVGYAKSFLVDRMFCLLSCDGANKCHGHVKLCGGVGFSH